MWDPVRRLGEIEPEVLSWGELAWLVGERYMPLVTVISFSAPDRRTVFP